MREIRHGGWQKKEARQRERGAGRGRDVTESNVSSSDFTVF